MPLGEPPGRKLEIINNKFNMEKQIYLEPTFEVHVLAFEQRILDSSPGENGNGENLGSKDVNWGGWSGV